MNYLICPNCGNDRLHQIVTAKYNSKDVDFKNTAPPVDQEVVYVCPCQTVIDEDTANRPTQIVVITGNSQKYRESAILVAGFKLPKDFDRDSSGYVMIENILFITEGTWKSPPEVLQNMLASVNIQPYDVTDGNFKQLKGIFEKDK